MSFDRSNMRTLPEMESAERALDAALDEAATALRDAEDFVARLDAEEIPRTDEEIQQFVSYVTGSGRTAEWDAVAARVSSGEITWRAIAEGTAAHDPGIIDAYRSNPRVTTPEEIENLTRAATGSGNAAVESSRHPTSLQQPEPVDDDDYFENSAWLR